MFSSLATILLLPLLARPILAARCTRNYVVQQGDYCDSISAAQKVSTFQLSALNPKIDEECSNLFVGQKLCLGLEGQDCTATQVVQPHDTCSEIQQAAGVDATVFHANNPQIDDNCSNLYIGEVLCISKEIQVPDKGSNPPPAPGTEPAPGPKPDQPAPGPDPTSSKAPLVKPTDTGGNGHDNSHDGSGGDDEDLPYCDEL